MPVGKHDKDNIPFTQTSFSIEPGDEVICLTDGFPDQFGGPQGKKFKYKPLKQLLLDNCHESLKEQKNHLDTIFVEWKGNLEQVDDVTIVGIKFS
jgi:serine phosphatase RsbU (regulator of sigma subunit)